MPSIGAALHADDLADPRPRAHRELLADLRAAGADRPYACGNCGVNTMQPVFYPSGTFGALLPAQTNPTIGDRLNEAGVDWAWYAGGWSNANGDVGAPGYTNGCGTIGDADGLLRSVRRPEQPERRARGALAAVPEQPVPVPPPAVQLLRHTSRPARRQGRPTGPRTCRTRSRSSSWRGLVLEALQPEAGQLHQAVRHRERAPGLRERAERQRPPRRTCSSPSRTASARSTRW